MCGASRAYVLSASTQSIVAGDGGDARGAHGFLTVGASGNRRGRAVAAQTQCGRARRTARTTSPARLLSHRSDTPTGARLPFECAARGMPIRLLRFTSARAKPFAKRLEASFGSSRVRRVDGAGGRVAARHDAAAFVGSLALVSMRWRAGAGRSVRRDRHGGRHGRHRGFPIARTVRHVSAQDNETMDQAPSFAPLLGKHLHAKTINAAYDRLTNNRYDHGPDSDSYGAQRSRDWRAGGVCLPCRSAFRPVAQTLSFFRSPSSGRRTRRPLPRAALHVCACGRVSAMADSAPDPPDGRCSAARNAARRGCCRYRPSPRSFALARPFLLPSRAVCGCARRMSENPHCV